MTQSANRVRRRIGLMLPALLAAAALPAAAQSQAQRNLFGREKYGISLRLKMFGEVLSPRVEVRRGEQFALEGEHGGKPWRMEFTVNRGSNAESVRVAGKISSGDTTLAAPALAGSLGQRIAVRIDDRIDIAMIVKEIA